MSEVLYSPEKLMELFRQYDVEKGGHITSQGEAEGIKQIPVVTSNKHRAVICGWKKN